MMLPVVNIIMSHEAEQSNQAEGFLRTAACVYCAKKRTRVSKKTAAHRHSTRRAANVVTLFNASREVTRAFGIWEKVYLLTI